MHSIMKRSLLFIAVIIIAGHAALFAANENDTSRANSINIIPCVSDTLMVTKQRTLEIRDRNKAQNRAVYGDFIQVEVKGIRYLIDSLAGGVKDSIILCLNNIPMTDIHPRSIGIDSKRNTGFLVFYLDRKSKSLIRLEPYFISIFDPFQTSLSVGVKGKTPFPTEVSIILRYIDKTFIWVTIGMILSVIFLVFFVSKKIHILQTGNSVKSPYSLAQIQLTFWTILVSFSYIYLWIVNGEMPDLPPSILMLLGISIGTKGFAGYIDHTKKTTYNTNAISQGFLRDILSDDTGINIQRSQMLIWTLILGFIYLHAFIVDLFIPDFDTNILALMGISSGTYVLLKTLETKTGKTEEKTDEDKAEGTAREDASKE
jgi:hypothetical protein